MPPQGKAFSHGEEKSAPPPWPPAITQNLAWRASGGRGGGKCGLGMDSPPERDAEQPRDSERQQQHPPVSDEVSKQWQQHVANCKKYANS